MFLQPYEGCSVQLLQAGGGHHLVEGFKQGLDDDAELQENRG